MYLDQSGVFYIKFLEKHMNDYAGYALLNLPSNCKNLSDVSKNLSSMTKNDLVKMITTNIAPYIDTYCTYGEGSVDLRGSPMQIDYFTSHEKGMSGFVVGRNLSGFYGQGNGRGVAFFPNQLIDGSMLMYGSRKAKWVSHILESFDANQLNEIRLVLGRPISRKDYSLISKSLPTYSGEYFNVTHEYGYAMDDFRFTIVKACLDGLSRTKAFKAAA
jgi:hypothetical protein